MSEPTSSPVPLAQQKLPDATTFDDFGWPALEELGCTVRTARAALTFDPGEFARPNTDTAIPRLVCDMLAHAQSPMSFPPRWRLRAAFSSPVMRPKAKDEALETGTADR